MKRIFIIQLLYIASQFSANAQRLEIHQLGLGDGDCALVIVIDSVASFFGPPRTDTAVVLIDGQRASNKSATQITSYIDSILGKELMRKKLDYIVVTHIHYDHYGNIVKVLTDLKAKGYYIGSVFDRTGYSFPGLTCGNEQIDSCYGKINGPPVTSASAQAYMKYVKQINPFHIGALSVQPGKTIFNFKSFKDISMICLAANGAAINAAGKITPFLALKGSKYEPHSENDLSLVFLVSYQGFRYFTGGDIGGPGSGGNYTDGETPISNYLVSKYGVNFHACVLKVSHHGSSESTDAGFLTRMNPTLAVIPASLRTYGSSKNPLPTCITLTNLTSHAGTTINYTFVPKGNKGNMNEYCKYKNLDSLQDVVIKINKDPGYGAININITRSQRSTDDMSLSGTFQTQVLVCNKQH